jgi:hypothetical protein
MRLCGSASEALLFGVGTVVQLVCVLLLLAA